MALKRGRQPTDKAGMRSSRYLTAALPAGLASLLLIGCAARPSVPSATHEAIAQQADERRKASDPSDIPAGQMPAGLTKTDYERFGDQYVRQGNLTLAFAQYGRSLRVDSRQSRVRDKLGLLYAQKGFWEEAQNEFQRILQDDAAYAPAHEGLGQVHLAGGRAAEAETSFRRAIELNPHLWKSHAFLGLLYDSQGKHAEAFESFRSALAIKPGHQALLNNTGRSLYLLERYEEAVDHFQRALQTGQPTPALINNFALTLAKLERYEDAFELLHRYAAPQAASKNLEALYRVAGHHRVAAACGGQAQEERSDTSGHAFGSSLGAHRRAQLEHRSDGENASVGTHDSGLEPKSKSTGTIPQLCR